MQVVRWPYVERRKVVRAAIVMALAIAAVALGSQIRW